MKQLPHPIQSTNQPTDALIQPLIDGINDHAALKQNLPPTQAFMHFAKDNQNQVIAGIFGSAIWGTLQIDCLWVHSSFRNQGYGKQLLSLAEQSGINNHCTQVSLYTMNWEALIFYKKYGYQEEFTRTGYTNGATAIYLIKPLLSK